MDEASKEWRKERQKGSQTHMAITHKPSLPNHIINALVVPVFVDTNIRF